MARTHLLLAGLVSAVLHARGGFDPVRDLPIALSQGVLTVVVPPSVHLKARTFRVVLLSPGTLQVGAFPPPSGVDEAGDPIWRGTVRLGLSGQELEGPVRLQITCQPCTEGPDGVCFLPVKRSLTVATGDLSPRP